MGRNLLNPPHRCTPPCRTCGRTSGRGLGTGDAVAARQRRAGRPPPVLGRTAAVLSPRWRPTSAIPGPAPPRARARGEHGRHPMLRVDLTRKPQPRLARSDHLVLGHSPGRLGRLRRPRRIRRGNERSRLEFLGGWPSPSFLPPPPPPSPPPPPASPKTAHPEADGAGPISRSRSGDPPPTVADGPLEVDRCPALEVSRMAFDAA